MTTYYRTQRINEISVGGETLGSCTSRAESLRQGRGLTKDRSLAIRVAAGFQQGQQARRIYSPVWIFQKNFVIVCEL